MLNAFGRHHDRLVPIDLAAPIPPVIAPLWIDLVDPTADESELVAARFGVAIPSRADMDEIEPSARLYWESEVEVMTVTVALSGRDEEGKQPVTFALAEDVLVTVRYAEPTPFGNFVHRPLVTNGATTAETVMLGMVEAIIDRIADALERVGNTVDGVSREVFDGGRRKATDKTRDLEKILERIGRQGDLLTRLRESLVSVTRMLGFHSAHGTTPRPGREARARLKTLQRDLVSLTDHAGFLASKVNFLLDATLGLINLEQNQIIKIFTVAAVAFLPPTLIASIYGMNFETMPELRGHLGYPFAILLMILSAALPFFYFRRRGWL